jgi:essential nuclear protein 1
LLVQLGNDELQEKYGRLSQPGKRKKSRKGDKEDDDEKSEVVLDPKTSKRIFELAKSQQDELELPDEDLDEPNSPQNFSRPRLPMETEDEDEDEDEYLSADEEPRDFEDEFQIDSGDMKALDALLPPNANERKTLADIIFAKLASGDGTNTAMIKNVEQDEEHPDPALT